MTPEDVLEIAIEPSLKLLPEYMNSPAAKVMLLAIGLQESRFQYRRQIRGPARGFWQFELGGGTTGTLKHYASKKHAEDVMQRLCYRPEPVIAHEAIEHNDILAAVFARLYLWTTPDPLPTNAESAWNQYLWVWRPGKPHRQTWDDFYRTAWLVVQ